MRLTVAAFWALSGCSGATMEGSDAGADAGGRDAAPDARASCVDDIDCTDGVYCDGVERCSHGAAGADARGCVAASPATPCLAMQTCEEATRHCMSSCAHAPDADGDGRPSIDCGGDDCDDADANRYPGNHEVCDTLNRDEDCDPSTFGFRDGDGDSYADAECCNTDSTGALRCGDDCNDSRPNVHPALAETCDGLDNDCNGMVDEGVARTFYPDVDGDGFGDSSAAMSTWMTGCVPPAHFSETGGDCADGEAAIHPGALEQCDVAMADENCDGTANPATLCACAGDITRPCMTLSGVCAAGTERCIGGSWGLCSIGPLPEICNGLDDNCNGATDEGLSVTCYPDADNDGYAISGALAAQTCPVPGRDGFAGCPSNQTNRPPVGGMGTDCNDANSTINPGAAELCDTARVDEDCDGTSNPATLCACTDGDVRACTASGSCGAGNQTCTSGHWSSCSVNPVPESCNGVDDDCDGMTDEGLTVTCYADNDNDGFALATAPAMQSCPVMGRSYVGGCPTAQTNVAPVVGSTDCNDLNAALSPSAIELCDAAMVNEDCDATTNEGCSCTDGATMACGTSSVGVCRRGTQACASGTWTTCAGNVEPGTEVCNGLDDDCDGMTDEALTAACYADADGDAYGTGVRLTLCRDATRSTFGFCPAGYTGTAGDCNDANPAVRPMIAETCNGNDDDCDGTADDGFFCPAGRVRTGTGTYGTCVAPGSVMGIFTCRIDCTSEIFTPTLPVEACDGLDNNCDGVADDTFACVRSSTGNACVTACGIPGTRTCSSACNFTGAGSTACRTTDEGAAVPGSCNGCDDDGDGNIDDVGEAGGFACRVGQTGSCMTACGVATGTHTCLGDCSGYGACSSVETCNGCDDDLDGAPDDAFACVQNQTRPCTFDSNGATAGCTGISGTQTCNGTCSAWGTCGRPTEVCNYICDDNANGTTDDDRDVAYSSSFVDYGGCAAFSSCGTCTCPLTVLGYTDSTRIANAATTWQVGYTWLNTTANIGYGNLVVSPDILVEAPPAGLPNEGYAIIFSDNVGALWEAQPCGVPYARTGLAIEWRFTPSTEPDTITIRHLTGSGTGTVIGTPVTVPPGLMYAPRLDDATVGVIQHNLSIAYTPDDPNTAGSEQHLRVATYAGVILVDVDLDTIPALFQPNEPVHIGFTARTTATTANVYLGHGSILGNELSVWRYRICAGY